MKNSLNLPHILVIDDDKRIRELLKKYLIENNFLVSALGDTSQAYSFIKTIKLDLMILDLMLPGENGFDFANRLRSEGYNFPIIMLTAMGEIDDKIKGLEIGADDYIVKPFEPKELLLRINNILKRNLKFNHDIIYFGDFCYSENKKLLTKGGVALSLTSSELMLLELLIKNANKILSREELAKELLINERSVDVQIVRLRSKIESSFLQTIRNQGYVLRI